MKNYAIPRIQAMKSYSPPLEGRRNFDGILLDFNERTVAPSAKVRQALKNYLNGNKLQVYPEYGELEKKLTLYTKTATDQIIITSGVDQAIDLVFRTFTNVDNTVIIPAPSFAMFSQSSQAVGNKIISPRYNKEDMSFPTADILKSINQSTKLIVICTPNNPTGTLTPLSDIEIIAKKALNAIILIDEVYFEFSNVDAIPLIKKYPNIIVARTFSKAFGLASMRIGYLIGSKKNIQELLKVRGPYDVNMFGYIAACAALDDLADMRGYVNEVMNESKPLLEKFFTENRISFYESAANFILFKPDNSEKVELILRKNGILVRIQNKAGIENTLRVSIGTVEQIERFIEIYKRYVLKNNL